MDCILAIDVGTQSLRASIIDPRLCLLERRQIPYSVEVKSGNQVEIDAEVLWQALARACTGLTQKARVGAVSLSTLCPSLLAMAGDGTPLSNVILHLDRRSYAQAKWILSRIEEERFLQIAGNLPVPGGISVTSLLWIRDHFPEIYFKKEVCFGHAVTFFCKRLTDRFVIDPSNASFTGLFDTVGYGDWDDRLLDPLGIEKQKLPEVMLSASVAGELAASSARLLGLPKSIPVVIGANDTTCSAVGAGLLNQGDMLNTSGTVEILVLCLEKPVVSRNHLLRTHAYPGKWLAMRTVGAGGASIEWFRKNFCQDMSKNQFYDVYLADILSEGRRPKTRFHPYLTGDRNKIKQRTGSFTRLTLDSTREDLLLALVHGIISYQIESISEWKKTGTLSPRICHVGGGASDAYTAYKQRLFKDYEFVQLGETTLVGAAILARDALGG